MKTKEVILIGGGGHAHSLLEFSGDTIKGYIATEENPTMEVPLLGSDADADKFIGEENLFHVAYVYSKFPTMEAREKLLRRYIESGARFVSLIAPTAIITPNSEIGEGCAVMNGAIINRAVLGRHVIVNSGAIVEHDCNIGANSFIGPGAIIGGFTTIGKNCFIGLGAKIANGITIRDNISVAMGAVVSHDLTEPGIYHGPHLKLFRPKSSTPARETISNQSQK